MHDTDRSKIPHRIERSRNRTSRATLRDGWIVIRLAGGLSATEEQHHVDNLLRRMTKAALREVKRTRIDPFRPLLENAETHSVFTAMGLSVEFLVTAATLKRTRAVRTGSGWRIERGTASTKRTFHRFLWKLLGLRAAADLEDLVRKINDETFREDIRSVTVKFMRSRWGSCSLGRNITLSTPLLFTTPEILRYVIIHELAHIPHPNHSERFWNAVEVHDAGYRQRRIQLRNMSLPKP